MTFIQNIYDQTEMELARPNVPFSKFCYQIKQRLLEKYNKRWKKIAMKNAEMMFCENKPYIMDIMKR